ncbi:MAG: hypothetical protein MUO75_04975 [Actinobacteria bacterium]|nr:hypothetical protein [Actinomycetota bacterium]
MELQVGELQNALKEIYKREWPGLDGSSENASGKIARLALDGHHGNCDLFDPFGRDKPCNCGVARKQKCLQEREDGSPCEGFIPCPRHFREQNMKDYLEKRPEESRKNYCPGCDGSRHAGPCEGE